MTGISESLGDINGFQLRPRKPGELIDIAIRLAARSVRSLRPVAIALSVPAALYGASLATTGTDLIRTDGVAQANSDVRSALSIVMGLSMFVLLLIAIPVIVNVHLGKQPMLRESARTSLRKIPALLAFAVVSSIAGFGLVLLSFIPFGIAAYAIAQVARVVGVVGMILFVPLYLAWSIAIFGIAARFQVGFVALLIEKIGPMSAIKRGFKLSKGRWMHLGVVGFAMTLLTYVVVGAFFGVGWLVYNQLGSVAAVRAVAFIGGAVAIVVSFFVFAALPAAMYVDSRTRNDALDLEQLGASLSDIPSALV